MFAAIFVVTGRLHATSLKTAVLRTLPMLAVTAIVVAPYVVYLSWHSGSLRFEGKSTMNYMIAQRINAGMEMSEAELGIGSSLEENGPWLSPNRWIIEAPPSPPLARIPGYWLRNALRTAAPLRWILESAAFGGILMNVLVVIGWLRPRWRRERAVREIVLAVFMAGYAVVLLGQHQVSFLYVVPMLPFLIVLAAHGIDHVAQAILAWSRRTLGSSLPQATWHRRITTGLLFAGVVLPSAHGFTQGGEYKSVQPSILYREEAGLWLARHAAPRRVMSTGNEVPFYSDAMAVRFPHAKDDLALAYVHLKSPDYLVLIRERNSTIGTYYDTWRKHGVPDSAASLIMQAGPKDDPEIAIYRWHSTSPDRGE
jgi:hypothetical protein